MTFPTPLHPPITQCKSCHADIIWCRTKNDKAIPLDAKPTSGMVIAIDPNLRAFYGDEGAFRATHAVLYTPHHATCPQGKQWRRPTK